ncbi:MAG: 50S ribosomal protein L10, partial [Thermoleophilia bacterium]|nr:50S ribosomal protein L10 [Thermoleophilia bacterium]
MCRAFRCVRRPIGGHAYERRWYHMLKERKEEVINEIEQQLNSATSLIVTDYRGLGVQQLAEIRNELRSLEASLLVSKNTLTRIAATRAGQEGILEFLSGPTAIAFCHSDPAPVAKALAKAA